MQRVLSTVTLLGLLVATAAAFAITEHLKLMKSPVFGTQVSKVLSPVCDCPTSKATVRIRLRHTGRLTVIIVDSAGHKVATIASNVLAHARSPQHFVWDGRTDAGVQAPDGIYHPWVELPRHTYRFTNNIVLDTRAPEVLSAKLAKPGHVLFGGPGRSIAIRYALSGKAHAVVYLGGRQIIVSNPTQPDDKIKWAGRLDHRALPAGRYVLSIGAEDIAGNKTPADKRKQVTVVLRYIEVTPGRLTVRPGRRLRVHVESAARRYTWRLGHRHGERRGKLLRLKAPSTPGTYRLVAVENGHAATAVVRVRGK